MGMVVILINGVEPFEETDNTPLTEGLTWNLETIGHAVSEKQTFEDNMILFMYTAQRQGQITLGDQDSASKLSWFWRRRFLYAFTIYGHGGHLT